MGKLRELLREYDASNERCAKAYATTLSGIHAALSAVGGYATTSANMQGLCRYFRLEQGAWSEGVVRSGEGGLGPHSDCVAPSYHLVGDACADVAANWRKAAYDVIRLDAAIAAEAERLAGAPVDAAQIRLALLALERDG